MSESASVVKVVEKAPMANAVLFNISQVEE